jgi:hypothetical protein
MLRLSFSFGSYANRKTAERAAHAEPARMVANPHVRCKTDAFYLP